MDSIVSQAKALHFGEIRAFRGPAHAREQLLARSLPLVVELDRDDSSNGFTMALNDVHVAPGGYVTAICILLSPMS
jgi:hypothetical protein